MKKLGILLKVFSSEEYKECFLNGDLYMNTINYFRKYEEEAEGNIGDKFEALTGWMHPHEFVLEIEINGIKHKLNPDDMAGPATTSMKIHDHANVFCMTQLHSHDIDMANIKSDEEYERVREYFTLPDDVKKLGKYMVVITDPKEFVRRSVAEGKRLLQERMAIDYQSKQVIYYDEAEKSLMLDNFREAPFYKQSIYSHQNEYRLCLTRDNPDDQPYVMHIGDLRSISMEMKTSEFNSMIEIRKKQ
ncbi:hypothetical protein [Erwinia billingiae]|uniref:hypothetical protein n=1 Tax=Erwinia billingiae TaxID=182337 RepID=UPI003209A99D